jgi:3-hydroxymyristoyl/3-hydroxydecanoyl-(acyl carrier protein) dehydratase
VSWLSGLPHQIPFRAASTGRKVDDKTIEGSFLCTTNDFLTPQVMLVEAMAQLAGGLVFGEEHGFLTGMDDCEVSRAISPGDVIELRVTFDAEFAGTFRFSGTAMIGGLQCARGRFYLAKS